MNNLSLKIYDFHSRQIEENDIISYLFLSEQTREPEELRLIVKHGKYYTVEGRDEGHYGTKVKNHGFYGEEIVFNGIQVKSRERFNVKEVYNQNIVSLMELECNKIIKWGKIIISHGKDKEWMEYGKIGYKDIEISNNGWGKKAEVIAKDTLLFTPIEYRIPDKQIDLNITIA